MRVCIELKEFGMGNYITWISKVSYYDGCSKIKTSIITKDEITQDIVVASLHGVIVSLDMVHNSGYIGIDSVEIKSDSLIKMRALKASQNSRELFSIIYSYSKVYNINIIGEMGKVEYDKVYCG